MKSKITYQISKDATAIADGVEKAEDTLRCFGIPKCAATQFSLYLEEMLVYLSSSSFQTHETFTVQIRRWFDEVSIRIKLAGEEVPLEKSRFSGNGSQNLLEIDEAEVGNALNRMLLSAGMNSISHTYQNHINIYTLTVKRSQYFLLIQTVAAIAFGLLTGAVLKYAIPTNIQAYLSDNIFHTFANMFLNAVKMLIGPLVFCSIASCIGSFSDFSTLKKLGKLTLIHYALNAVLGIALAAGICWICKPGAAVAVTTAQIGHSDVSSTAVQANSIWQTIGAIIPSNLFAAFHDSNILQLIFVATLVGIALGQSGEKCRAVGDSLKAWEHILGKITKYVMAFLPVMVYCSMARMMLKIGMETVLYVLYWIVLIFGTYLLMMVLYLVMVWVKTKESPIAFLKKTLSCLLIAFSIGSSSASMSTTALTCQKDLKIKPSVYSFTVPLGVSIHSCSSCIFYIISTVFLSNLYLGTNAMSGFGLLFYFSVFMLAFGAPSVSGAGPICVSILLTSVGVPMEYIALIVAWDPIVSTIKTACSCMEDLTVAYMVDRELR